MNNEQIVQVMGSNYPDATRIEMTRRLCELLGISPEKLAELLAMLHRLESVETRCQTVVQRCATLENVIRMVCCPANQLFSAITGDNFSHQNQVNLVTPVPGLGGDYVDGYPVTPGKKIRLTQVSRPGYAPTAFMVALNLANGGTNFLDIAVTLYVTTDPKLQGEKLGSEYRGFQFFNNEGIPTPVPMPLYKNMPLTIGTMNYLMIELHHQGSANNLVSAFAAAHVNAQAWYAACGLDTRSCS